MRATYERLVMLMPPNLAKLEAKVEELPKKEKGTTPSASSNILKKRELAMKGAKTYFAAPSG